MTRIKLLAALFMASLLATPAVEAATMQAVFSGTVLSGKDTVGHFGLGADLAGQTYTQTFVFDTEAGTLREGPDFILRSSAAGSAAPVVTKAFLTINGTSLEFGTTERTNVGRALVNGQYDSNVGVSFVIETATEFVLGYLSGTLRSATAIPFDLDAAFTATTDQLYVGPLSFSFETYDQNTFAQSSVISGKLNATKVVFSPYVAPEPVTPAPVPVPAAGLLLLGGIGALALMRRRKQA